MLTYVVFNFIGLPSYQLLNCLVYLIENNIYYNNNKRIRMDMQCLQLIETAITVAELIK